MGPELKRLTVEPSIQKKASKTESLNTPVLKPRR